MEFHNIIYALSEKGVKNKEHCSTEEATKTSLILPFITALGYDTSDPLEVLPEAPCAIKGFDRIDYILAHRGEYRILVECKHWKENLDNHVKQLEQYFQSAIKPYHTRIGVLTNGMEYRFYADCDSDKLMDDEPFFVFDISKPTDDALERLKMFRRDVFDADRIVEFGRKSKFDAKLHKIVDKELSSPSDELVNLFWYKLNPGKRLSRQKREIFSPMVKEEIANYTSSRINRAVETQMQLPPINSEDTECSSDLTEEEQAIVDNVYSILSEHVSKDRLHLYRNWWKQITVRLDNDQFHTICKLNIGVKSKWVAVSRYWPPSRKFYIKDSFRLYFDTPDGINQYAKDLKDTLSLMLMDDNDKRKECVELHHKDWLE